MPKDKRTGEDDEQSNLEDFFGSSHEDMPKNLLESKDNVPDNSDESNSSLNESEEDLLAEEDVDDSEEVVAPVKVDISGRPSNLPPSYLLSIDYSGPESKAYARLYEPESKKIFFWFDNTGHKPYCFTDYSV
ncbi:MAG: hypothetical protein ACFFAY_10380, partial [Promethearchaeota archaeon]